MLIQNDRNSYFRKGQPEITNIDWHVLVDFESKTLVCRALLTFNRAGEVSLDTRNLDISAIWAGTGKKRVPVEFSLGARHQILGSSLSFEVPAGRPVVEINYRTAPNASGLQWLTPEQTRDKTHPFLFSQGEMIHTRSYLPCQDTPSIRFTIVTELTVPIELRGLVAAREHLGRKELKTHAVETWSIGRPIPSYLVALAVGRLECRDLSERIKVWAEPSLIDAAAAEFEDLPAIMAKAEELYGPYPWGTYGVLLMPSGFPYGGMENPCLSFLTPSLIVGDKSGVSTVIHELAHSWTGNLITNATWRDFWLNEGWTVYAEYHITSAIYGHDTAMLGLKLLEREFDRDVLAISATRPLLTALAPDIDGLDPDDVFSRVPYFKGAMLFLTIEEYVGRTIFAEFVRAYIAKFAFTSITTAEFLEFLVSRISVEHLRVWEWVYEAGIPNHRFRISSSRISQVETCIAEGNTPSEDSGWSSLQMMLYLELLPRPCSHETLLALDERFNLSLAANAEVRWAFLLLSLESNDQRVVIFKSVLDFLQTQGRMKYLKPLYKALVRTDAGWDSAREIFHHARDGYHPIAAQQVEKIIWPVEG